MSLSIALLFMVLLLPILKLGGIIDWPWWIVVIPAYPGTLAFLISLACIAGKKTPEIR